MIVICNLRSPFPIIESTYNKIEGICRRLFYFLMLFLLLSSEATADPIPKRRYGLFTGIGNYEYFHAGAQFILKNKNYFEVAGGIKPWNVTDQKYRMGFVSYGFPFLKKKDTKLKYFLQLKALLWNLDNDSYRFTMLGTAAEIKGEFPLGSTWSLFANAGIMYNNLLKYDRKSFEEVGFPKDFQPSFSLQLCYRLN